MDGRAIHSRIDDTQVIRSFFSITSSQIAGRFIFLLFALYLMHVLGRHQYGLYQYVYGYTAYFLVFSGWGLDTYALKKISEQPGEKGRIVSNVSCLKSALFFLGAAVNFVLFRSGKSIVPAEDLDLFLVLYAALFFDLVGLTLQSVFIALKRSDYFFTVNLSKFLFYGLFGILFLTFDLDLTSIAWGFLLACFLRASVASYFYLSRMNGKLCRPDLSQIRKIFVESMPYAFFILLASIYVHVDAILIGLFISKGATGVYDAAYKVIEGTLFISAAFATSLMPYFVTGNRKDERLDAVFSIISFVGFVIVFTLQILSPYLHFVFSDDFVESDRITYFLAVYIPLAFVNQSLVYYHLARENNWQMIRVLALGCLYNVVANVILIPNYGIDAAIVNTFLTEMLICFFLIRILRVAGRNVLFTLWVTIIVVAGIMTVRFEYFDAYSFAIRAIISGVLILALEWAYLLRFHRWYKLRKVGLGGSASR